MPRIICTLPNASDNISGVKFSKLPDVDGVVSEEITDEQAELFLSIKHGYQLFDEDAAPAPAAKPAPTPAKPKAPTKAEKAAAAEAEAKAKEEAEAKEKADAEAAAAAEAAAVAEKEGNGDEGAGDTQTPPAEETF